MTTICTQRIGGPNGSGGFDLAIGGRITAVRVWSGCFVDAIQFQIDGAHWTERIGGPGGNLSVLTLSPGEFLAGIRTRSGLIVDWIEITTSSGRKLSAGGRRGKNYGYLGINGRISRVFGTNNSCNGFYVIANLGVSYTPGNFKTPKEEADELKQKLRQQAADAIRLEMTQISRSIDDINREQTEVNRILNERQQRLAELRDTISHERAQLSDIFQEPIESSRRLIVLLGMTGDGKSTLGNRLCGDTSEEGNADDSPFKASLSIESQTTAVETCLSEIFGQKLCVVDTPGLADSLGRDRDHVNQLIQYLRGCGGVNQFFIVKSCTNPRLNQNFKAMLDRFETLVGRAFWNFVTVVLTGAEGRFLRRIEEYSRAVADGIANAHACPRPRVIGIGFDDFEESLREIVCDIIPAQKFQCDALTSPVEELETEAQIVESQLAGDISRKEQIEERLNELTKHKQNCQRRLNSV